MATTRIAMNGEPDVTTDLTPDVILKNAKVSIKQDDKIIASMTGTLDEVKYAEQLKTGRKINGTLFDGTKDITTDYWGNPRNLTIGKATKTIDGTKNVEYTLDEIGSLPPYIAQSTPPENTKTLWIDTSGDNGGLKYHDGTNWVHVPVDYS